MNRTELRAERIERLREEARKQGLDGALVYSWRRGALGWFCGYSPGFVTNYGTLWVPIEGEPVLGVRHPYEKERAEQASGLSVKAGIGPEGLLPSSAKRVGWVGGDFFIDETPPSFAAAAKLRQIELVDLKALVDEWRVIKVPAEVEALRKAAVIGDLALKAAGATATEGETDFSIAARVEAAGRSAGAFRISCLVGIGDGAVATEAHGKVVGVSDPVGLEINLEAENAFIQTNGTLLPAAALPHQLQALEACQAVRKTLLEALKPGVSVDQIVAAGDRHLSSLSLHNAKEYDFGHGIGADTPEHPRLVYGTRRKIETGMVLAVHVAVRRVGGETAFAGRPVLITETGAVELV